jgi:hypothetical protein
MGVTVVYTVLVCGLNTAVDVATRSSSGTEPA